MAIHETDFTEQRASVHSLENADSADTVAFSLFKYIQGNCKGLERQNVVVGLLGSEKIILERSASETNIWLALSREDA